MQYLKMFFLCAMVLFFVWGCSAGLEEDALNIDGDFFPLRHFEHRFTFPEYDRDIMPQFSEELTQC